MMFICTANNAKNVTNWAKLYADTWISLLTTFNYSNIKTRPVFHRYKVCRQQHWGTGTQHMKPIHFSMEWEAVIPNSTHLHLGMQIALTAESTWKSRVRWHQTNIMQMLYQQEVPVFQYIGVMHTHVHSCTGLLLRQCRELKILAVSPIPYPKHLLFPNPQHFP